MDLLNRMMSYDKAKCTNQENCNCEECIPSNEETVSSNNYTLMGRVLQYEKKLNGIEKCNRENINFEYSQLSENEIENIIKFKYWFKNEKTKEFIRKSLRIQGDRYDYTKSNYMRYDAKVKIKCKYHGYFRQEAKAHYKLGQGCVICGQILRGRNRRLTIDEFIQKSEKVQGKGKYNYSKVNYIDSHTEVEIICCNCNKSFPQRPYAHMNGEGCPYCYGNQPLNTEEFISKAKSLNNGENEWRYDYSKVKYINYTTDVIIKCNIENHGYFKMSPSDHLNGRGCSKCANHFKYDTNSYIDECKYRFKNKFDYGEVNYISSHDTVRIKCNTCNRYFKPIATRFLQEGRCPYCNAYKGEYTVLCWLESHNINYVTQKIFDDCRYHEHGRLRFDFYIPSENLCIEYDGIQHFEPHDFTSKLSEEESLEKFKISQIRDQIKNDYCKKNEIKLLRIRYDENIEEKLNEYFSKYSTIFDL